MPFQSEKQRRFLWKNHPEVAKKWAHKYGSEVSSPKDPEKAKIALAARSRLKKKAAL